MDAEFLHEWSASWLAAWNDHDPDEVARHCTESVVWEDPSLATSSHGRAGVRAFAAATFTAFPDFHVDEADPPVIVAAAPRALSRYRLTGTMLGPWEASNFAPTGARIAVEGVDQWTFTGELMSHYTTYYDSLDMARQMGTMIPPIVSFVVFVAVSYATYKKSPSRHDVIYLIPSEEDVVTGADVSEWVNPIDVRQRPSRK